MPHLKPTKNQNGIGIGEISMSAHIFPAFDSPSIPQHPRLQWFSNLFLLIQIFHMLGSQYENRYSCPVYNLPPPLPTHTHIILQNISLEADTLAHIPSLITGFQVAAWASSAHSQAWDWCPCDDQWASGITQPLSISTLGSSNYKGGVSALASVITLPVWCLRPRLSHK